MPNNLNTMSTAGLSAVAALAINGGVASGLVATGSTQGTALLLSSANNFVGTTAAGTGVIVPAGNPGDEIFVYNGGANSLAVYPPVGGTINNLAANASLAIATTKAAYFVYSTANTLAAVQGA